MSLEAWMAGWHAVLDDALRDLRRVTPERDPARWDTALARLDGPLRAHLAFEETVLMPVYRPLSAGLPENGAPEVLARDHALIRALLDRLAAPADDAGGLLARGDALGDLAGVLEHHDRREQRYVVPTLGSAPLPTPPPVPAVEPLPPRSAPPPSFTDPDPLRAARLAVLQDGPLDPVDALPLPDHPKAPRQHARLRAAVDAARAAETLDGRRDALAALDDALRTRALLDRGV